MAKEKDGVLIKVRNNDLVFKKYTIPNNVTIVGSRCCAYLKNLTLVTMHDGIEEIEEEAFYNCANLLCVVIPGSVQTVGSSAFGYCDNLLRVDVKPGVKVLAESAFEYCDNLKYVTLGDGLSHISRSVFSGCENLKTVTIPASVVNISEFAFRNCKNLKEVIITSDDTKVCEFAFSECLNLSIIKYGNRVIDVEKFKSKLIIEDLTCLLNKQKEAELSAAVAALEGAPIKLPVDVAVHMAKNGKVNPRQFDCFKKFIQSVDLSGVAIENLNDLHRFAYNIGCFSADAKLRQRATNWLSWQIETGSLLLNNMYDYFSTMPIMGECAEFSEFLFGKQGKESNFQKILMLDDFQAFLNRVQHEFHDKSKGIKPGGRVRDENGKLKFIVFHNSVNEQGDDNSKGKYYVPTVKLFQSYFSKVKFSGVETKQDEEIAAELMKWPGMEQVHFDRAKAIMHEFNSLNVSTNIVGKHLKDITNEIADYQAKTKELAERGVKAACEVINSMSAVIAKEFTWDWIEKNDPLNFCLGLYCDCCANLAGFGYGIVAASIIHSDVQTLVIRNKNGDPVAKATMYVNREQGYGVFNNVEVSSTISTREKDEIYQQFKNGVNSFAQAYNNKNPHKPLKQITVGMNNNDLEQQIKDIRNGNKPSEILHAINYGDYGIRYRKYSGNWNREEGQYLVWQRDAEGLLQGEER